MAIGQVDVNEFFLAAFLVIIAITTIYSISKLDLIAALPNDMRLTWAIAVISFLVLASGAAWKGTDENLFGNRGGFSFKEEKEE